MNNFREPEKGQETLIDDGCDWKRISSFKPQFVAIIVVLLTAAAVFATLQEREFAFQTVTALTFVPLGLVALTCKFVHKRDNEIRVSSIFNSETVSNDDVCMQVKRRRWWWTSHCIHLRRPTRFGWAIKYVPVDADGRNS